MDQLVTLEIKGKPTEIRIQVNNLVVLDGVAALIIADWKWWPLGLWA